MKFEKKFKRIEDIVKEMNSDLDLEKNKKLYLEAKKLVEECESYLEAEALVLEDL